MPSKFFLKSEYSLERLEISDQSCKLNLWISNSHLYHETLKKKPDSYILLQTWAI